MSGRHVCGDAGGLVLATGQPCGQGTAVGKRCVWHKGTADDRRLVALKGQIASRMRTALPASTPEPPFDTVENIVAWAQRMARAALVDDVDPRRLAEARGFAQLALSALSARTQQQLVDALLALEHGGAAVALLAQFTQGTGKRKPLPGRTLTVVPPPPEPAS